MAEHSVEEVKVLREEIADLQKKKNELKARLDEICAEFEALLAEKSEKLAEESAAWVDEGNKRLELLAQEEAKLLGEFYSVLGDINVSLAEVRRALVQRSDAPAVEEAV